MTATTLSRSGLRLSQRSIGAIIMIFGLALMYGVGFAQSETLHDAAHDTRHSVGFPCH